MLPLTGALCFTACDPVPEGYKLVIVSKLHRAAVSELGGDTSRLATVNGLVFWSEEDIVPCGCTGLCCG
jgi:hypothetical protein